MPFDPLSRSVEDPSAEVVTKFTKPFQVKAPEQWTAAEGVW